jgi:ribosome-associated toxin RatA of RatAB toxin-antitoxin module
VICALLLGLSVEARPRRVKSRKSTVDPIALAPILSRGELALVESGPDGRPRQVITFSLMNVSPEKVFEAISNVSLYPKYLFSVDEAKVLSQRNGLVLSEWSLNIPIIGLAGSRAMRASRPSLVEFKGVSGHFKHHHERWDLIGIDGGKKTLVMMNRSVDLSNNGGLLLKAMIALEPSMEHGMYIAASFVQIQDLRRYLEKKPRAKIGRHQGAIGKFDRIGNPAELKALKKLMELGEVSLIESHPDGSLKQTAVMTVIRAKKSKVLKVAHDVQRYPDFVPNLVRYDVSKTNSNTLLLDYEIDAPLINIEGIMNLEIGKNGNMNMKAVSGDIKRGHWLWTFTELDDNTTIPINYSYTDITEASWFVKKLVEIQPLFEHGVVVAASTVQVRAIKARAEGRR